MTSSPLYRFFLDRNKQIDEPIGWDEIRLELNRDKKYWSLVESVELPFEFYGADREGDGGYEYIREARAAGPDVQIEFLAEISWDYGASWETLFDGLLDMTTLLEKKTKRRFQCGIIRSDSWSRFINLQDNPVAVPESDTIEHTVVLPPQKVRQLYVGRNSLGIIYNAAPQDYVIFSPNIISKNEIGRRYNLPPVLVTNGDGPPSVMFEMDFAGDYHIQGEQRIVTNTTPSNPVADIEMFVQINEQTPIQWTSTDTGGLNGFTTFTYDAVHTLSKGDTLRFYFRNTSLSTTREFVINNSFAIGLNITADTTYPSSSAPGFYIHDIADRILLDITGGHYMYSDYFGGINTDYIEYPSDGCGVYFHLFKGIHLRGQPLSLKPFSLSWSELWDGINPVFCLGAGYEIKTFSRPGGTTSQEMLVVAPREYFFDSSSNSVELVEYDTDFDLEITYDPQFLITSVNIGYRKWQAQTISGNDDPQTSHRYTTRFKTVGDTEAKNVDVLSSFVAASLAIEQGRRMADIISQDWPMDEDTFIVQGTSSLSPTEVKLYAAEPITGLNNAETRYNVRLTPASNLNRWLNWLSIAFQEYPGDSFRFRDGEGNILMTFNDPAATGCDAEPGKSADENGDVVISEEVPFLPAVYKFQIGMTWEQYRGIRDNRKKSIGLTYSNEGVMERVSLFIISLSYFPEKARAEITGWEKVPGPFTLESSYTEGVGGSPQWTVVYDNENGDIQSAAFTGSGSETDTMAFNSRVVSGTLKLTNAGIAEGNGAILFKVNGVTVNSVPFSTGDDVTGFSYNFEGLTGGETISIEITEG